MAKKTVDTYDFLLVVPTLGEQDVVVPTFKNLWKYLDGTRTHLVYVFNPMNKKVAEQSRASMESIAAANPNTGCKLEFVDHAGPVGFAKAVNSGIEHGTKEETPRTIVFINDDVYVTDGFMPGFRNALDTKTVRLYGEPIGPTGVKPDRPAEAYGRIGMTGPTSDNVAGIQHLAMSNNDKAYAASNTPEYAANYKMRNVGNYITADFLSGFCVALDRDCYNDVLEDGKLLDERFGIGGFEDNDLCVRVSDAGYRCVVAGDIFVHHVGHQTLDRFFAGQNRGLANRAIYYDKYKDHTNKRKMIAAYRVKFSFVNDFFFLRASLAKIKDIADGVALVLTANPLEVTNAYDWERGQHGLHPMDKELLQECHGKSAKAIARAMKKWLTAVLKGSRAEKVKVRVWEDGFNEREERNECIALAESMGADWIYSVDADEVPEDRINRTHFERLMSHPDPMVRCWDVSWLNHWDSPRLCRVDPPWADGMKFKTGMRGFRLWRVNTAAPRRIMAGTANGLHCGNCPDFDVLAKRVSSIRFRHFGYLRPGDRQSKYHRYTQLDKEKNAALLGNSNYSHLVAEEGMQVIPYVAESGIVMSMLVHAGEEITDVYRWMDETHGLVDHTILVWTDTEHDEPTPEFKQLGESFGVQWVTNKFDMDLSACRNAGLEAARQVAGCSWHLTFDPDEWLGEPFSDCVALRRMAETSDSFGWLLSVLNYRPTDANQPPTVSETIRMVRMDKTGVMKFHGRVHEGFDVAIRELQSMGIHPQLKFGPFMLHHRGLAKEDAKIEQKLQKYTAMLVKELEDNPASPGAWVSLGLQYANDGDEDSALECYHRGVAVAGDAYLPYKELAMWHLRRARALFTRTVDCLTPAHRYKAIAEDVLKFLNEQAPPQPLLGNARRGNPNKNLPGLPPFPQELIPGYETPVDGDAEGPQLIESVGT